MAQSCGIPDMRFINRQVPIVDVARKLDLLLEGSSMIHCWHPEHHQHGDRTASVGIRASNNTVKCFGCDLSLLLEGSSMIHCWHPEHHQHGDRTASVGIRASNNTVKCFGCDSRPMGPVDLVMDVHGMASPADEIRRA